MSSIRRNVRLRQEYLYRKSLEGKEKEAYEQRKRLKEAIARGVPVAEVDREHAQKRLREEEAADVHTDKVKTHVDDEYANAGFDDPKVCVTTSRDRFPTEAVCQGGEAHISQLASRQPRWPQAQRACRSLPYKRFYRYRHGARA